MSNESNSIYCTQESPVIKYLFGQRTDERVAKKDFSKCDSYQKLCEICLKQVNQIKKNKSCDKSTIEIQKFLGKFNLILCY